MTLEQTYGANYALSDGEILSIHIKNQNGTIVEVELVARQFLKKEKYRVSKLLMTLTGIVELSLFDNSDILGSYSDITIEQLDNGNYYVSFDPYGNTHERHKSDNNVFISRNIEFAEILAED